VEDQQFNQSDQLLASRLASLPAGARAAIALGSNLGDRAAYLLRAITGLLAAGIVLVRASDIYETAPVDYLAQPAFLNQVILVGGAALPAPGALLALLLHLESELGRTRTIARGPRTIDLDLLFYDQCAGTSRHNGLELILPHPRLHTRRFVLAPLAEILPDGLHPVLKCSYRDLLAGVADDAPVSRYQA
jgi:2-amino-4-hydroxy-6-hydroxymethyldihydropteridine diphosphokinase